MVVPILIPLALLILLVIYLVVRFTRNYSRGSDRPVDLALMLCGACGYPTTGITTLHCPECGHDLRRVGILPRKRRPRRSLAMLLSSWTGVCFLLAIVGTSILAVLIIPRIYTHAEDKTYTLGSSPALQQFDIDAESVFYQWPWSSNLHTSASVCRVKVTPKSGAVSSVIIDAKAGTYQITTPISVAGVFQKQFDSQSLDGWMTSLGVDVSDPQTRAELNYVLNEIYHTLLQPIGSHMGSSYSFSAGSHWPHVIDISQRGSCGHGSQPSGTGTAIVSLFWLCLWIAGIIWIVRRLGGIKAIVANESMT